jgi:small subunit ribosomal protein S14
MAKQWRIQREVKRQKLVVKYSKKITTLLKELKLSNSLSDIFFVQKNLQRLPNNSAEIRLKNRCWRTGRSRGFYRDFGLSRHVLREMAHQCLVPGLTKSSW